MAVDFSLLPSTDVEDIPRPSAVRWSVAFVAMVSGIALVGVLAWPEDEPKDSLKFWWTVGFLPVMVALFVVLRRYSHYEGRNMYAETARAYSETVFAAASRPLVVLASGYRIAGQSLGIAAESACLDHTAGDAGMAAPWLALACAIDAVPGGCQVVLAAEEGATVAGVVRSGTARPTPGLNPEGEQIGQTL
ncbi:hypothetical protein [Cupriavidus agavae]|uniref:Uncharacterized protein n=1 Tax=Cupriavidus agavae TaxID=1001822 RepID=A0A4Q7RGC0_9BURK|nr:hypothetical protein [Cupriavidus agavae]RZT30862.1 hypothetical protein EV147_4710 [Cupriavidus agavae]